jgi:hypothetical protein
MNEINLPSSSSAPDAPLPVAKVTAEPPVRLGRLLSGLAVAVAAFDSCFWGVNSLGFSAAVFVAVLAAAILANRSPMSWRWTTKLIIALLAGAVMAAVLETGITNVLVLLILILALAGDTFFADVESPWGRGLSQIVAMIRAPGRVFWLAGELLEAGLRGGWGGAGGLIGGCLLTLPALVLAVIFGSLLASGNAVFESWTSHFFDWFWKEMALYLDVGRIVLWLFVAFLVLPLLRPVKVSAWWWEWTERLPRLPEILPNRGALFSSGLILVTLNLLFLAANSADVLYLWSGNTLPDSIASKSYVHQGVNALMATVLLSALVLTAIFHQALEVARRRELKALAGFWIAQNFFLMLSVGLRVKNYIVDYNMTVLRLSVIIFLLLVAVGFILLSIKIMKERSLSWLVGGCVLAVFVTFYLTQFLDLAGWSANYNCARWAQDRGWNPQFHEFREAGPAAWPALRRAHELDPTVVVINDDPNAGFVNRDSVTLARFDGQHWREFSLRAWLNRWALEDKK